MTSREACARCQLVNAPEVSISALLELKAALDALPVAGRSSTIPSPEEPACVREMGRFDRAFETGLTHFLDGVGAESRLAFYRRVRRRHDLDPFSYQWRIWLFCLSSAQRGNEGGR
jgi:hypothetical protein